MDPESEVSKPGEKYRRGNRIMSKQSRSIGCRQGVRVFIEYLFRRLQSWISDRAMNITTAVVYGSGPSRHCRKLSRSRVHYSDAAVIYQGSEQNSSNFLPNSQASNSELNKPLRCIRSIDKYDSIKRDEIDRLR